MTEAIDSLKTLHTGLVDTRHGYEEALGDAHGEGLSPLFRRMVALHADGARAVAELLLARGVAVDDEGSFMSTVHRRVMDVRSMITGLGANIAPALIDGEQHNFSKYDAALGSSGLGASERETLGAHRARLTDAVADMRRLETDPAQAVGGAR